MQNPMYGMPNYSFQSPFGNGMNTSYQNQQLPHYDIVKVNGRNGAEAFQMGPNSQVLLLDETAPVLWLASTDGAGYKTVSAFDISPHQDQQQTMLSSIEQRLARLEEYIYEPSESGSRDAKQRNPKQRNNGQQQSNANVKASGLYRIGFDVTLDPTAAGTAIIQMTKDGVAMPEAVATVTTVANTLITVHVETTRYIAVPCHVNSPAYGVVSSGVAGTVTHVTGYAVKLD